MVCVCLYSAHSPLLLVLSKVGAAALCEAVRGVVLRCALLVSRLDVCGVANPYVSNGFSGCVVFVREGLR